MDYSRLAMKSRELVNGAALEVQSLGGTQVKPEHLLDAILRNPIFVAFRVLTRVGWKPIEKTAPSNAETAPPLEDAITPPITLSPDSIVVMQYAHEEADRIGNPYVGTEHFLLGLYRFGQGNPALLDLPPFELDVLEAEIERLQD